MASQDPPLDEVQWKAPDKVMELRGIHENSILYYFAYSPFFDQTSNNAVVFSQAMRNQSMLPLIETRAAFEGYLKTMSGLEYVVAQEPAEMAPGTGTGVWVIRKQTRRKRQGQEDEITIHATYFVVGENIYMAPTLCDILSGRMLQITSSLNKIMSKAASLTEFTPSLGNTYLPPATNQSKATESQPSQESQNSQANTPLPDSVPNSKKAPTLQTSTSSNLSTRLLEESLSISLKYGDEYMDENPITGFPGDFHLSTTGRKEKDKLMVPQAGKNTVLPPTKITIPPPTINSKTDSPTGRKGSKADKSPKTPGMPKPKRRKSKALMSGGTSPV